MLKKKTISKKLKEEIWIRHFGEIFSAKCPISWCSHKITVFCFEAGHNIPESKGGRTAIDNLIPICGECNRAMGDRYTIDEFSALHKASTPSPIPRTFLQRLCCFMRPPTIPQNVRVKRNVKRTSKHFSIRNLLYR
jgi:hypothetical protein